jgi:hypothetical protein
MWELFSYKKRRLYVFENPIPLVLNENIDNVVKTKYQYHIDDDEQTTYVMLSITSLEFQT